MVYSCFSKKRACSSAGRAPAWHAGGRRFDPDQVHQIFHYPEIMKMNGNSDKQHFFAQMFLKGFCNENNQIYMFDSKKNKVSNPRNKESVARQKHLYTIFSGGERDYTIEKKFSKIENQAVEFFEKIRKEGLVSVSYEEIPFLIDFIVLTFVRTPIYVKTSEQIIKNEKVQQQMKKIHSEVGEKFIQKCLGSKGLFYAESLVESFEHRHRVITHNFDPFLLTTAEGSPPFIINDRFMCIEPRSKEVHYIGDDVDWSRMNVIKHFPITNKHCVSFVPKSDPLKKGTNNVDVHRRNISTEAVRKINAHCFQQKGEYAYCSDKNVFDELLIY